MKASTPWIARNRGASRLGHTPIDIKRLLGRDLLQVPGDDALQALEVGRVIRFDADFEVIVSCLHFARRIREGDFGAGGFALDADAVGKVIAEPGHVSRGSGDLNRRSSVEHEVLARVNLTWYDGPAQEIFSTQESRSAIICSKTFASVLPLRARTWKE